MHVELAWESGRRCERCIRGKDSSSSHRRSFSRQLRNGDKADKCLTSVAIKHPPYERQVAQGSVGGGLQVRQRMLFRGGQNPSYDVLRQITSLLSQQFAECSMRQAAPIFRFHDRRTRQTGSLNALSFPHEISRSRHKDRGDRSINLRGSAWPPSL